MPETTAATENSTKTVLAVKVVDVALVRYKDDAGTEHVQLALIGDNNVHMLDSKPFGLSRSPTPQGVANEWLKKAIFEKMGKTK